MIRVRITLPRNGFTLDARFEAGPGVTALFGPSGSGKTTVLNAIAGLERPAAGEIATDTEIFFDSSRRIDVPSHHRRIGYVFQDALLFPHMTVEANLRYGRRASNTRLNDVAAALGITDLLSRRPAKLSGGERQRVAIGRALLSEPRILLMDEPLAALDMQRKQDILPLIETLRDEIGIPILYVSHAADEVARLADRVLRLEQGRIVDDGPPERILARTVDADRFGRVSVLTATVQSYDPEFGLSSLAHPAGPIGIAGSFAIGRNLRIVIHATDVTLALARHDDLSVRTALEGTVAEISESSLPTVTVLVTLEGGQSLAAAATRKAVSSMGLKQGTRLWCLIKTVSIDERWLRTG